MIYFNFEWYICQDQLQLSNFNPSENEAEPYVICPISKFLRDVLTAEEDVEVQHSTEKLVDLVFVLATKLDLNVNDMRSLLLKHSKENSEHFEAIRNKEEENLKSLNDKIENLNKENSKQRERIDDLEKAHEDARIINRNLRGEYKTA